MTSENLSAKLQAGIDAVKRGQKKRGRELLLEVVAEDERLEQAWYWLSLAVDSLDDKIVALENVLAINPENKNARASLTWLHKQHSAGDSPVAEPVNLNGALTHFGTPSPVDPVGAIDDPHQCIYCGAHVPHDHRQCMECGRNLMEKRKRSQRGSGALRTAAFGMIAQTSMATTEFIVLVSLLLQGRNVVVNYVYETLSFADLFGDYLSWPPEWTPILLVVGALRVIIYLLLLLGLLQQMSIAYYSSVTFIIADILWTVFRWYSSFLGIIIAIADVVLAVTVVAFVFASDRDFEVNEQRILCKPDRSTKGGIALNRMGHIYRREGKWALALAYWRAAVAAMPERAEFYKDAAVGYGQIGYYKRAIKALEEAGRQAPYDNEIVQIRQAVEEKRAADLHPRE